jgi:ribonuclease HI
LLRIRVPKDCDDDGNACDALRGVQARGLLFADCAGGPELTTTASRLLEIKVVEIPLVKSASVGQDGMSTTDRLVQLDEDLDAAGAFEVWNAGWIDDEVARTTFDFPDRDAVIGLEAATERGWATDWTAWGDLVRQQERRREQGQRTTLLVISDGSVLGKNFSASSTYGWICYAVDTEECEDRRKETGPGANRGYVMAGGGKLAGPPEWTSSTRAEATGLLAALMGIITAGWQGDIELRLDNDSAVGRAGGLVLEAASDSRAGAGDDDMPEQVLRDAMTIENSDIWTEFVSWRDEIRRTGARVRVVWHPGHPERRKAADRSDWSQDDHAIFLVDEIADAMHSIPERPRQPTQWSHQPAWNLQWRGTTQLGCIAQRLHDAVRTEQLASYLQGTGLGKGADGGWLIPELISRTIARKEGTLGQRVHRAKVVASILGTKYTQHRRNGLGDDDDPMCRLCGSCLETDNHVLWECTHRGLRRCAESW